MSLYSVIIPVFNSEQIVEETVHETVKFFTNNNLEYQIVLVNDCSPDGSWGVISRLASNNPNIVAIDLLKNYGQHSAIFHGIKYCRGDYIITMDDDLQNPPQEIIKLIDKISEGYDLVFGKFIEKKHCYYRKIGTKLVGWLNYKIFNKPKNISLTNFRIFTDRVAKRILNYRTAYPYIPGLLLLFSKNIANVEVEHKKRKIGASNYSIFRIFQLMGRILFNYSSYPLKILTGIGFIISLVAFFLGLAYLIKGIIFGSQIQGWTTLVVLLSFFNGFMILLLGILGEYIVRLINLSANQSHIYEVAVVTSDDQ